MKSQSRICTNCGLTKSLDKFSNEKHNKKDGKHSQCKNCRKEMHRQYRIKRRKPINDFKLSHPCAICGEEDISELDFHHINPKEKIFKISLGYSKTLKELKQEIVKCIVLCHSCHSLFHHFVRNPSKTPKNLLQTYREIGIWLNGSDKRTITPKIYKQYELLFWTKQKEVKTD